MNTNKQRKQEVRRALHDHSLSAMVEMGWRGISNSSADHADNREDDEAPALPGYGAAGECRAPKERQTAISNLRSTIPV